MSSRVDTSGGEAITRAAGDTLLAAVDTAILGIYRTIVSPRGGAIQDTDTAATRLVSTVGAIAIANSNAAASSAIFYLNTADHAVSGKTTKLNLRATLNTNATSVGTVTYTAALTPISGVAGGADASTVTLGTNVSGSTVTFVNPSTSTSTTTDSGDFTMPSSGLYALTIANDATGATDCRVMAVLSLRVRNV